MTDALLREPDFDFQISTSESGLDSPQSVDDPSEEVTMTHSLRAVL